MALPFFYLSAYSPGETAITLDEDNSRHVIQVLRMQKGEALQLTDGKGWVLTAVISDDHKKKCRVTVTTAEQRPARERKVTVAMSLLKNTSRFEWFLEKAMEIGVSHIIPLICQRTEKQHFRQDRMQQILVSALLQSQQAWLPVLDEPAPLGQVIANVKEEQRFIAHCLEENKQSLKGGEGIILIGPEGDFTREEIDKAMERGFLPVTLGDTRLRTETAGIVAATLMCIR